MEANNTVLTFLHMYFIDSHQVWLECVHRLLLLHVHQLSKVGWLCSWSWWWSVLLPLLWLMDLEGKINTDMTSAAPAFSTDLLCVYLIEKIGLLTHNSQMLLVGLSLLLNCESVIGVLSINHLLIAWADSVLPVLHKNTTWTGRHEPISSH